MSRHWKHGTNSASHWRSCWARTARRGPPSSATPCPPAARFALAVRLDPGGGRALPTGLREATDGTVFLPTVLPLDPRGDIAHPGDFPHQYAHCLRTADRLLHGVGLSLDHAVTTYDYSTPATRRAYPLCAGPRRELLGGAGVFPGAGGILMSRLHAPGILVALDVTASRHPSSASTPAGSATTPSPTAPACARAAPSTCPASPLSTWTPSRPCTPVTRPPRPPRSTARCAP